MSTYCKRCIRLWINLEEDERSFMHQLFGVASDIYCPKCNLLIGINHKGPWPNED
jgi:hypothetical protein